MTANPYRPRFGDVIADLGYSYYCGPAVLSVITGKNVRDCVIDITRHRKSRGATDRPRRAAVVGMTTQELLGHIVRAGIVVVGMPNRFREVPCRYYGGTTHVPETVGQWLKRTAADRGDDVYLVVASHHFFLISGNEMADCQRGGRVRSIADMKYKRARINQLYCLLKE